MARTQARAQWVLMAAAAALVAGATATCTTPADDTVVAASCDGIAYDFSHLKPDGQSYFVGNNSGYVYYVQLGGGGLPGDGLPLCTWDQRPEWKFGNIAGQAEPDGSACYPIGKLVNQSWSNPTAGTIQVDFLGGQDGRKTTIQFICDKTAKSPVYNAAGEIPPGSLDYEMDIRTLYACEKHPNPSSGGAPGGWIVIGVFFGVLIVYFLFGFVFLRFVQKKEGREAIPQVEFWTSLPGLVKEGGGFIVGKVRGKSSTSYESI